MRRFATLSGWRDVPQPEADAVAALLESRGYNANSIITPPECGSLRAPTSAVVDSAIDEVMALHGYR